MTGTPVTDPNSGFSFDNWLRSGGDRQIRRFVAGASYQRIGWVFAAINAIARTASGVPLVFKEPDENGNLVVIEDQSHPVNVLFNPPDGKNIPSINQLLFRTEVHLGIDGGVFWTFKKERGFDTFTSVSTKRLTQMKPVLDTDGNLLGWVEVDKQMRTVQAFRKDEVIPFFYYNPTDELKPLSPLSAARLSLESEFNMNAWNAAFFKQGLRSPLALKLKQRLSPTQEKEWEKRIRKFYGGIDQAQGALLLPGGVEAVDLPLPTKDIEFIEGKKLNREEILAIYGVPPAMVGIFEFANYANSREQRKIFYDLKIIPENTWIVDIINQILLQPFFPGVVAEFDWSVVEALQPDPTEIANAAKVYFELGYNREEIANILNAPKLAERIEPDEPAAPPPEEEPTEEPIEEPVEEPETEYAPITPQRLNALVWDVKQEGSEAWWMNYGRAHEAMMRREEEKLTKGIDRFLDNAAKALKRKADRREPIQLSEAVWMDNWSGALDLHVERVMTLAGQVTVLELANPLKHLPGYSARAVTLSNYMNPQELEAFERSITVFVNRITRVGQDLINELNARVTDQLTSGQTIQQIRSTISRTIEETFAGRATTIARTTANAAYNNAKNTLFAIKGVETHRWVNSGDNFVRESHMQEGGNETRIGQPFPVTRLLHPHDPSGPPQEVINCRCTTVAVAKRTPGQPVGPRPETITDNSNLDGLGTVSLQTQLSDIFNDALKVGRREFDEIGVPPTIGVEQAQRWGSKVLGKEQAWRAVSRALDNVPIKTPGRIITDPTYVNLPATMRAPSLTKQGKERLVQFLQQPLPSDIREQVKKVRIIGDGRRTRGSYNLREKVIEMPANDLAVLTRFMNDPLEYMATGGNPGLAYNSMRQMAHEYGHHVQNTVTRVRQWARTFFKARTIKQGQSTLEGIRAPGSQEVGLPDKFHDRYQGRVYLYEFDPTFRRVQGTEVVSMFYEKVSMLPLQDWWLDIIQQSPFIRGRWQRSVSKLFLRDTDGAKDFMKELFGDF